MTYSNVINSEALILITLLKAIAIDITMFTTLNMDRKEILIFNNIDIWEVHCKCLDNHSILRPNAI